MAKVLVTGGAGFIGRHVVMALHCAGHEGIVIDSYVPQAHADKKGVTVEDEYRYFKEVGFDLEIGQVGEAGSGVLADMDAVIHLAAEVGVGQSMYDPHRYVEGNSLQTARFLARLHKYPSIKRVVVASSMSIYGEGAYICKDTFQGAHYVFPETDNTRRFDLLCPKHKLPLAPVPIWEDIPLHPTSIYGLTKYDQERTALIYGATYGIPTCALRFFNVYGPGQSLANPYTGAAAIFANRILNGKAPIVFEDGKQSRDFIYVHDIARGVVKALESDYHGPVNLGTGERTSLYNLALTLGELIGGTHGAIEVTGEFREGDIRHGCANVRRAKQELGWAPLVTLRDGMAQTAKWMVDEGGHSLTTEVEALRNMGLLRK